MKKRKRMWVPFDDVVDYHVDEINECYEGEDGVPCKRLPIQQQSGARNHTAYPYCCQYTKYRYKDMMTSARG